MSELLLTKRPSGDIGGKNHKYNTTSYLTLLLMLCDSGMRKHWLSLVVNASVLLIVLIGPLLVVAVPAVDLTLAEAYTEHSRDQSISSGEFFVLRRDDDRMHMHHGAPLTELNETAILQWHDPTPPSYWSIDVEDRDPSVPRYPELMALHVVFMTLAFFFALPTGKKFIGYVVCLQVNFE